MTDVNLKEFGEPLDELYARVEPSQDENEQITAPAYSYWKSVVTAFFANKLNYLLLILLVLVIGFAFIYPRFIHFDRYANIMSQETQNLSPVRAISKYGFHLKWLFGTGSSGESMFDAVWSGAGTSLGLAFLCGIINIVIGTVVGTFWGYVKKVDGLFLQIYYTIGNVPYVLIVAVILMIFEPGFFTMVFALTVTGWMSIAYDIRTQVMILRGMQYNTASEGLGSSAAKIVFRNIMPHLISVVATLAAIEIPACISYEVFFSYIGIGIPQLSLGRLIYEAEDRMFVSGWNHEFWFPVAVVCLVTGTLYLLGQHLGDAADPGKHY